jgi:hypothetical protein
MRMILIATLAGLMASTPALAAWDYNETEEDDGVMVSAWDDSSDGSQLAVECDDIFTDPDLYVFTSKKWDDTANYPGSVPLTVTVDGVPTGPLTAGYENIDGELTVTAYFEDDERIGPLYDTLRHARNGIEVSFFDQSTRFGADGINENVGRLIERCAELGGE